MNFFDDHKKLFGAAGGMFLGLTILVCIIPALQNEKIATPLPGDKPLTSLEMKGKELYIANGCVGCHTHQVRDVYMDKMWGSRPGIAADYALIHRTDFWRNTATLMGTERTGPDLTDIGNRNGSEAWNLLHLYNPRAVVKASVMPAFPWLFEMKDEPGPKDVVVNVPSEFLNGTTGKVVATEDALALVAYLQSLKQVKLPDGSAPPAFLYEPKGSGSSLATASSGESDGSGKPTADGKALYATHCQTCHQESGEGLAGAFPPLKGSKIVLDDDASQQVDIIMNGYTGLESQGYGPMPNIGSIQNLSPEEVAAIVNHERVSWGNKGKTVTVDEVKKLMEEAKVNATQ